MVDSPSAVAPGGDAAPVSMTTSIARKEVIIVAVNARMTFFMPRDMPEAIEEPSEVELGPDVTLNESEWSDKSKGGLARSEAPGIAVPHRGTGVNP